MSTTVPMPPSPCWTLEVELPCDRVSNWKPSRSLSRLRGNSQLLGHITICHFRDRGELTQTSCHLHVMIMIITVTGDILPLAQVLVPGAVSRDHQVIINKLILILVTLNAWIKILPQPQAAAHPPLG